MAHSSHFIELLPKTAVLLEKARGDVFPAYAAGLISDGAAFMHHGGCGLNSLFDLASVSKVLCTTTLCALVSERGLLRLDQSIRDFFPSFADERVKISHLLNHSGGFPAWLPLHSMFHEEHSRGTFDPRTTPAVARERYEKEIFASWKASDFEKDCVYSDLGFMLLGWVLEKALLMPLDAIFQELVAQPLGLESIQFLPISPDIVPTENCPWRGHVLRGEVHDDNAYVLGGIAGHAGLFCTIRDVLEMGRLWLEAYLDASLDPMAPRSFIKHETAKYFWTFSHVKNSPRVLGWDGISPGASSTGQFFHSSTRGHLGYTGTSLWIDPERKIIVSLLTNRVHPSRANEKIKAFRPVFHDSLLSELGIGKSS